MHPLARIVVVMASVSALAGCGMPTISTSATDKIVQSGDASLQSSAQDLSPNAFGPRRRQFLIAALDGKKFEPVFFPKVYAAAPGPRRVLVVALIQDGKFGGFDTLSSAVEVPFEARTGVKYEASGRFEGALARVWIEEVSSKQRVSDEVSIDLAAGSYRASILIPIP